MAGDWAETTLGGVADFLSGGTPSTSRKDYWGGTIPWVSAKDMKRFRLEDTEDHVTEAGAENGTKVVPAGTVLLLARGMTLLNDVPICVTRRAMAFNQDVKALRPKQGVRSEFLPYLLLGHKGRLLSSVDLAGHGTGRLNSDELKGLDVLLPPEPEQHAIAHVLGALDEKIELNRRMSETLEAMARGLFDSWSKDVVTRRLKVADLIREGVLEIGDGYRAKNSELGEPGLPFVRAGDLNGGIDTAGAETLRQDSASRAGTKIGRPGDIAFTSKGTIGRFARVSEYTGQFVYSPQVCYWRSLNPERLAPSILYCWMLSADFMVQIEAVAGQTDMAPYVSLRDQRAMEVPAFPSSQAPIARQLDTLLGRQSLCAKETKTLGALRDGLLPKLISGEVDVSRAEAFFERQMQC
ncbi:MAG: restriction endonuclease subunit S [Pirellulaceae bacterium]